MMKAVHSEGRAVLAERDAEEARVLREAAAYDELSHGGEMASADEMGTAHGAPSLDALGNPYPYPEDAEEPDDADATRMYALECRIERMAAQLDRCANFVQAFVGLPERMARVEAALDLSDREADRLRNDLQASVSLGACAEAVARRAQLEEAADVAITDVEPSEWAQHLADGGADTDAMHDALLERARANWIDEQMAEAFPVVLAAQ